MAYGRELLLSRLAPIHLIAGHHGERMKIEDGTTKAARGAHYLCCAIMILALGGASGCSTAVLAGCGVGIASGAALGGIAAASAKGNSVDVGTVMLGGSIFGLVSGCSAAAVANAVATSKASKAAAA
ncbi:MAG: hypothetical protein ABI134_11055, partial [Byssovorax sp.]